MGPLTRKLILVQGYSEDDLCNCRHMNYLVRWTPLACSVLGLVGILSQSPHLLLGLGLLTAIGAVGDRSFFDYLYLLFVRPVVSGPDMPKHGVQRRFGCAIGASLFVLSAIGFGVQNALLAYAPAAIIVALAFVAAVSQWCFASTLYNVLFGRTAGREPR